MKNKIKIILLGTLVFLCYGCTLPFQSSSYPAWNTRGIIDTEDLSDGRVSNGWQGAEINTLIKTATFEFRVDDVSIDKNTNTLIADIYIKNTSDKNITLYAEEFPLIYNLEKKDSNYTYPLKEENKQKIILECDEDIHVKYKYEIDSKNKKPYAISYSEQSLENKTGNSYYIYIK